MRTILCKDLSVNQAHRPSGTVLRTCTIVWRGHYHFYMHLVFLDTREKSKESMWLAVFRCMLKGGTIKLLCALASMSHVSAPYNASIQQRAAALMKTWAFQAPDIAAELVSSKYLLCRCGFCSPLHTTCSVEVHSSDK